MTKTFDSKKDLGGPRTAKFIVNVHKTIRFPYKTTTDIIDLLYHQHRLLHPDQVESIKFSEWNDSKSEFIFFIKFITSHHYRYFYLKFIDYEQYNNPFQGDLSIGTIWWNKPPKRSSKGSPKRKQLESPAFEITQHFATLHLCAQMRKHSLKNERYDMDNYSNRSNLISRWSGTIEVEISQKKGSIMLYVMEESYVKHKDKLLSKCSPPKLYTVTIRPFNVASWYVTYNEECIGIDLELNSIPHVVYHGSPTPDEWLGTNESDVHESISNTEINCPFLLELGECNIEKCRYGHKKKKPDYGSGKKWTNPNIDSIKEYKVARKSCVNYEDEFVVDSQTLNWPDILPYVWIYQLTFFMEPGKKDPSKKTDKIRNSGEHYVQRFENLLEKIFNSNKKRSNHKQQEQTKKINSPEDQIYFQNVLYSYPMKKKLKQEEEEEPQRHNRSISYKIQEEECAFPRIRNDRYHYKPLWQYNHAKINHGHMIRQFMKLCNHKFGKYHLVGFMLAACLINYPPLFALEDMQRVFILQLEKDMRKNPDKVWQVLRKMSLLCKQQQMHNNNFKKGKHSHNFQSQEYDEEQIMLITREGRYYHSCLDIYIQFFNDTNHLEILKKQAIKIYEKETLEGRHEWVKSIKIGPIEHHLQIQSEESCRMFRMRHHLNQSHITFLKVSFAAEKSDIRFPLFWSVGNMTRIQAAEILLNGLVVSQALFKLFFWSEGQIRSQEAWLYSTQLSNHYKHIATARNDLGDFRSIRNPLKKMARMGLAGTTTLTLTTVQLEEIECIEDPSIEVSCTLKNGETKIEKKPLSDGCSIINRNWLEEKYEGLSHEVMSMQARIGGAKCEIISLPQDMIRTIILKDEKRKNSSNQDMSDIEIAQRRNLNAKIVITASSNKFGSPDQPYVEVAIKQKTQYHGAFTNKEFISNAHYHYMTLGKKNEAGKEALKKFEDTLFKYLNDWLELLNKCSNSEIDRETAIAFLETRFKAQAMKAYIAENCSRGDENDGKETPRENIDKDWLNEVRKNHKQRQYLKGPCLDYKMRFREQTTERDKIRKWAKDAYGDCLQKIHFFLPWPSTRMAGAADFSQILTQQQIFLRLHVPLNVCIQCPNREIKCNGKIPEFGLNCSKCPTERPKNIIYEGPCGLLKNPCLYPRGYRRFNAIYDKRLDELYPGECLLFSTNENCKKVPVFELSGADLDGDEFLVVTQPELLPIPNIDDCIEPLEYDIQGEQVQSEYVDDISCVKLYLDHQNLENTAELAVLHDAFSAHFEAGVGSKTCIEIAKAHAIAVDFAKQGKVGVLPKEIPHIEVIRSERWRIYPHHMGKQDSDLLFYSTSILGRLFDYTLDFLHKNAKDNTIYNNGWRKEHGIQHPAVYHQLRHNKTEPKLISKDFEEKQSNNILLHNKDKNKNKNKNKNENESKNESESESESESKSESESENKNDNENKNQNTNQNGYKNGEYVSTMYEID